MLLYLFLLSEHFVTILAMQFFFLCFFCCIRISLWISGFVFWTMFYRVFIILNFIMSSMNFQNNFFCQVCCWILQYTESISLSLNVRNICSQSMLLFFHNFYSYQHTVVSDRKPIVSLGRPVTIRNHVSADISVTSGMPKNFTTNPPG